MHYQDFDVIAFKQECQMKNQSVKEMYPGKKIATHVAVSTTGLCAPQSSVVSLGA